MSKLLKRAEILFQNHKLYVENSDKGCITVSENMDELPFLYLIHDKVEFNGIIMCLAVDYANAQQIMDLTLGLINVAPLAIGEQFYISPEGEVYWGDEAKQAFVLDGLNVADMEGPSKLWN